MKKVRTYIEIKEYEDGTDDIQVSGSLIHVLTNMISVLADLQKKTGFSKEIILGALMKGMESDEEPKRGAFTDVN